MDFLAPDLHSHDAGRIKYLIKTDVYKIKIDLKK